jgi:hypothetical protein
MCEETVFVRYKNRDIYQPKFRKMKIIKDISLLRHCPEYLLFYKSYSHNGYMVIWLA